MNAPFPLERIMLVDDDPDENFVNRRTIMREGLARNVIAFENPVAALAHLADPESPHTDLIVLDINMPEMSGFEFLEQHKALPDVRRAGVIIMLLTTSMNPSDISAAESYNSIQYRNKPLRVEMIVNAVREQAFPGGAPGADNEGID